VKFKEMNRNVDVSLKVVMIPPVLVGKWPRVLPPCPIE